MSSASESTIQALEFIVKPLPVGTNLALLHVLWACSVAPFCPVGAPCFPPCYAWGCVQRRYGAAAKRCVMVRGRVMP